MKFKSLIVLILLAIFLPFSAFSEALSLSAKESNKDAAAENKKEDQEKPTVDQILANHYKAIGGLEKWQKLDTLIMKGKMTSKDRSMPATAYYKRPNKCRVEFKVEKKMMAQVFNGMFAWQINPFAKSSDTTPMSPSRSDYLRDTCDIESSLIDYKKKGHNVSLLGEEEVAGKKAYKITVKYKTGNIETYYIDTKTYLTIKVEGLYNIDDKELRTTTSYTDFKSTNGYVVPHSLVIDIHGEPSQEKLRINKFIFNPKIDPSIFDFPKDKMINLQKKK